MATSTERRPVGWARPARTGGRTGDPDADADAAAAAEVGGGGGGFPRPPPPPSKCRPPPAHPSEEHRYRRGRADSGYVRPAWREEAATSSATGSGGDGDKPAGPAAGTVPRRPPSAPGVPPPTGTPSAPAAVLPPRRTWQGTAGIRSGANLLPLVLLLPPPRSRPSCPTPALAPPAAR